MTTFNLTENETRALEVLYKSCLDNMSGNCIEDLKNDPFTWCDASDLIDAGWSKHEAAGTYGALIEKSVVWPDEEGDCLSMEAAEFIAAFID